MTIPATDPEASAEAEASGSSSSGESDQARNALFTSVRWSTYWLLGGGMIVALLIVWWAVVEFGFINPYFLPPPAAVWESGVRLWQEGLLLPDTWASIQRILIGFTISLAVALPMGVLMGTLGWFEALWEPLIDFIRYMPAVAFVPLTIVWFGVNESQKWVIIFIGTFFQQVLMIMDNVKRTPREYVQVGETLGLGKMKLILRIVMPSSAPALWDTIRITLGWAWTWLVVAELVAASVGLGQRIIVSQRYLDTETIFFVIAWIGLIGLITDQCLKALGRRLFPWATGGAH